MMLQGANRYGRCRSPWFFATSSNPAALPKQSRAPRKREHAIPVHWATRPHRLQQQLHEHSQRDDRLRGIAPSSPASPRTVVGRYRPQLRAVLGSEFGHIGSGELFPPLRVIEEGIECLCVGCESLDLNEIVCRVETSHALMLNRDDDPGPTNDKDIAVVSSC